MIPSIDLKKYTGAGKQEFVAELGQAFEEVGFVAVKNHGVSQELIHEAYALFTEFFSLPDEVKAAYEIEGLAGQRGYTGKGKEHAKGRNTGDLKEFFHVGQPNEAPGYPANISVPEVPGLHDAGVRLYTALEACGKQLLRAIALHLQLDENYFDSRIENGNSILRAIHYFPIDNPDSVPGDAVRAGEHEDINLITLLIGASADGLEIKDKNNRWVPVTALPDHIVVNVGDMLSRLTNNRLISTTHRVVNPPVEKMRTSRYSMPFFLHPTPDTDLSCLPTCISTEHPKHYPDITAGEFLTQRLREIGLIK